MVNLNEENMGKAYAFFNYSGAKSSLMNAMPDARRLARLPEKLELLVMGGSQGLSNDKDFKRVISQDEILADIGNLAIDVGLNWAIEAKCSGLPNDRVASELGDALNCIYTDLYEKGAPFRAEIVYSDGKDYIRV